VPFHKAHEPCIESPDVQSTSALVWKPKPTQVGVRLHNSPQALAFRTTPARLLPIWMSHQLSHPAPPACNFHVDDGRTFSSSGEGDVAFAEAGLPAALCLRIT
jgi:hypothetical protein